MTLTILPCGQYQVMTIVPFCHLSVWTSQRLNTTHSGQCPCPVSKALLLCLVHQGVGGCPLKPCEKMVETVEQTGTDQRLWPSHWSWRNTNVMAVKWFWRVSVWVVSLQSRQVVSVRLIS